MERKVSKPYLLTLRRCTRSNKPAFSRSSCIRSTFICQFKFDRQTSSGSNDQAKLVQISAFLDHGWGNVAVYPCWPHVLITKLFQPSHIGVIPTVKELSEIFWCTIRALANDLHQFINNFESHARLQIFAWCFASLVLKLLKPTLSCGVWVFRKANNAD